MYTIFLIVLSLYVVSSVQQSSGSSFNNTSTFNQTLRAAVEATATARTCNDCYVRNLANLHNESRADPL